MKKRWSKDEERVLIENCDEHDEVLLGLLPSRTLAAIKHRINALGLSRRCKAAKLSCLLTDSPVAYYWVGFLLADGHFSCGRLKLVLSDKDSEHFGRFLSFICSRRVQVGFVDHVIVDKLMMKFGITSRKTYEPCDIAWIDDEDLFFSLVVGFVDGDGCICRSTGRPTGSVRIKCHSSWLKNLQLMSDRVCLMFGVSPTIAHLNKDGYAEIAWCDCFLLKCFKRKAIEFGLPFMERKWSRIDCSFVSRYELARTNEENVKLLLSQGLMNNDIASELCLADSTVSSIIKRCGFERNWKGR